MTTSLSRFQVRDGNNLVAPGQCAICGTTRAKWFLDFGIDLEYYGAVYFCNNCYKDSASELGFTGPTEGKAMADTITNLVDANEELVVRIRELENLNAVVLAAGDYSPISSWTDRPDIVAIQQLVESAREADREPREADPGSDETESGSSEPNDEFRFSDLFDTDSDAEQSIVDVI